MAHVAAEREAGDGQGPASGAGPGHPEQGDRPEDHGQWDQGQDARDQAGHSEAVYGRPALGHADRARLLSVILGMVLEGMILGQRSREAAAVLGWWVHLSSGARSCALPVEASRPSRSEVPRDLVRRCRAARRSRFYLSQMRPIAFLVFIHI